MNKKKVKWLTNALTTNLKKIYPKTNKRIAKNLNNLQIVSLVALVVVKSLSIKIKIQNLNLSNFTPNKIWGLVTKICFYMRDFI